MSSNQQRCRPRPLTSSLWMNAIDPSMVSGGGVISTLTPTSSGGPATPTKQMFGYFQQNLVSEYTYAESVADGVTLTSMSIAFRLISLEKARRLRRGHSFREWTGVPGSSDMEELDEDFAYTSGELDRAVTARHRYASSWRRSGIDSSPRFPGRSSRTQDVDLRKDDNHAEEIVNTVREVFGKGNDFAAKITYNARDPKDCCREFRNSPDPPDRSDRGHVATGTDVRPVECDLLRCGMFGPVRTSSKMKGRGARTIDPADFQAITPDAEARNAS